jgi:hypothetical protein
MNELFFTVCLAGGVTASGLITVTLALIALNRIKV